MELETTTPARERLSTDLLGWGQRRPVAPPELAAELRHDLETGLAALGDRIREAAGTRRDRSLWVTKSILDRLACDGWQLTPEPFEHNRANVRGSLAHAAIERDWRTERTESPEVVVARTWQQAASRDPGNPSSLSWWLNHTDAATAAELRTEVADLVGAFREVWPPLPPALVQADIERPVKVTLARGAITLRGIPDLVLSSRREDDRARTLVVDLKTGRPRSEHDRHELRFYALLVTLATGRPPFRWGTYYVTEGRAEAEDLHVDTLEATVRRVLDGVAQRVKLTEVAAEHDVEDPLDIADDRLVLRGGSWCWNCRRRPSCQVAVEAGVVDRGPDGTSQGSAMLGP